MDEIRLEIGVKENVKKKKLVSRTRAGHVKRMAVGKLAKRADAQADQGKWRRGRPKLRYVIALIVT